MNLKTSQRFVESKEFKLAEIYGKIQAMLDVLEALEIGSLADRDALRKSDIVHAALADLRTRVLILGLKVDDE